MLHLAFTHTFYIDIDGTEVSFEKKRPKVHNRNAASQNLCRSAGRSRLHACSCRQYSGLSLKQVPLMGPLSLPRIYSTIRMTSVTIRTQINRDENHDLLSKL